MFPQVCVCSTFRGGGTLSQVWVGGYPIPGLDGGGGTPSQVWMVGGGGTPSQVWMVGGTSSWGTPPTMTGWGTLQPGLDGGGYPHHDWTGYPQPGLDGGGYLGYPSSSIESTCYAAGSMPLRSRRRTFLFLFIYARLLIPGIKKKLTVSINGSDKRQCLIKT